MDMQKGKFAYQHIELKIMSGLQFGTKGGSLGWVAA